LEQVIAEVSAEVSADHLVRAEFDGAALEKSRSMLTSFRQFKELAAAIQRRPHQLHPERLWKAFEVVEPEK
jgi:hypothetical protein